MIIWKGCRYLIINLRFYNQFELVYITIPIWLLANHQLVRNNRFCRLIDYMIFNPFDNTTVLTLTTWMVWTFGPAVWMTDGVLEWMTDWTCMGWLSEGMCTTDIPELVSKSPACEELTSVISENINTWCSIQKKNQFK